MRAVFVLLVGLVTYANSFSGVMIGDDDITLRGNGRHHDLSAATLLHPDPESPMAGRPLVNVSFAMNYAADDLNLRGYHAVNLGLHLVCALFLFGLVRRTLELPSIDERIGRHATNIAFISALLWVVHPLNSEVVDYLTQRTESMMAMFYLATLYATVRGTTERRGGRWRVLAGVTCALGTACKESMVTAPLIVILFERTFVFDSWRDALKQRWLYYGGLASSWLLLAALLSSGARKYSAGFSSGASAWTYLLNQTVMISRYVYLVFWPRSLVVSYGPMRDHIGPAVLPFGTVVLAGLTLTAILLARAPKVGFLAASFFVLLAPTSSVIPIWTEVGAERRMYLPLASLTVLVVALGFLAWDRLSLRRANDTGSGARPIPAALVVIVTIALATRTVLRNRDYSSALTMARTVLADWPTPSAHAMVGTALAADGQHEGAIAELALAAPEYPPAGYQLGGELFNAGRLDLALKELQQFVRQAPLSFDVPSAFAIIGRIYMLQQRWSLAIPNLSQSLARDPSNVTARGYLADAFFYAERFPEAISEYQVFLAVHPNDVGALSNLGIALFSTGHGDTAVEVFRRAVQIDARSSVAHNNLVRALLNNHDVDAAVAEATRATIQNPQDADGHDLLGRSLLEEGRVADAIREFERAIALDPPSAQAADDLRLARQAFVQRAR